MLGWIPDSSLLPDEDRTEEQTELPGHKEVFAALGELDPFNDALRQLAMVAELLEFVEHVEGAPLRDRIRMGSLLRRVAEGLTDSSCASLFSGYVDPKRASRGDPNQSAGRLLRSFRDHDIVGMVEAANANDAIFRSHPTLGLLTLCPLLSYELTRESSQLPLESHIADFLADLSSPVCNAEPLQELLFAGLALPEMPAVFEALKETAQPLFTALVDRVAENQVLVGEYLKWSLRLEAVMNVENPSRALPQCGQDFHSVFATKASLLALVASEGSGMMDFKAFDAPQETVYGQWQGLLAELSPKGFSHRSVDSFTPEDLAQAFGTQSVASRLGGLHLGELAQSQPPIQDESWDLLKGEFLRHLLWLGCLSDLLRGATSLPEFWKEVDPESWGPYARATPVHLMQMIFLVSIGETEFSFSGDSGSETQGEEYEQFVASLKELMASAQGDIGSHILDGDLPSDELRALGAWTDLVAEIRGVEPQEPHVGFSVAGGPDADIDVWLGHFSWWLKNRAWRSEKERPVSEVASPGPAAMVKPSDLVDEPVGTGPEHEVLKPDSPMEIVFVGGDQGQAKNDPGIEAEIFQRYEDLVTVTWVHIDWTSNWRKDVDRVVGRLERGADVLVLMPLVRTGMGWHVRREAGRLGVPWVACTGRGTGTITRALEEAVQVVCRQELSETP